MQGDERFGRSPQIALLLVMIATAALLVWLRTTPAPGASIRGPYTVIAGQAYITSTGARVQGPRGNHLSSRGPYTVISGQAYVTSTGTAVQGPAARRPTIR
jgi:hypothetical protein